MYRKNIREQSNGLVVESMIPFAPPVLLGVHEWADKYRYLSPESSAEPGKWHTNRAEYQRGIMDAASDPEVETVVVMSSSQIGKTEIINNIVGYYIEHEPAPMLVVQPTDGMGQTWSKDRFSPMVRDTPVLKGLIKTPKSRDSGNTIMHKLFPGGHITVTGAQSPAGLASRPIRIVICDDIDRFPPSAGSEGDPVGLAIKRSTTFWNRLTILTSSPTIKDLSRIEAAWNKSDQRRFFVPCPKCKKMQYLIWGGVKWINRDPSTAMYECEYCRMLWSDAKRWAAVRSGEWQATAENKIRNIAGFHINEIYSSWVRLEEMVANYYEAKENPERLKVWKNTSLGEPWEEKGIQLDPTNLYTRREKYPAEVPEGGLVLTAAVDVQDDRLECEVIAWGFGFESWSIDYFTIYGDLSANLIWDDLSNKLDRTYRHESGLVLRIVATCVDSGGHYSDQVYNFCRGKDIRRIYAIKGAPAVGRPLVSRPSKNNRGKINLFTIGTDTAKQILYSRMKIEDPGPGYMHFPLKYDLEYFNQLTAEKATTKYTRGYPHRVWVKTRARNEGLDIRVYSMAALAILDPDFKRIAESFEKARQENPDEDPEKKQIRKKIKKKKGWVNGWKK